jgi:hypothetical protein
MPQDLKVKMEDRNSFGPETINLMKIAGIFDEWRDENGDSIYSFSIITFESNKILSWLHHRTPAILENDQQVLDWLDYERIPFTKALNMIKNPKEVVFYQVSNYVNSSRNRSEKCNQPISEDKKEVKNSPIKNKLMSAWLSSAKRKPESESSIKGENSPKKPKQESEKIV